DRRCGACRLGPAGRRCGHVAPAGPLAPRGVHAGEVAIDVLEPDLHGQQARFVGAGLGQVAVDLGQHVACLCLNVAIEVAGGHTGNVHDAVVNHNTAQAFVAVDALDFSSHVFSC